MDFTVFCKMPKDLDQQIRRHHVIAKAKAGCSVAEIMAEQANAFGDKAMSRAQVYDIVKKVKNGENMEDNRGKAINKFVRTEEMINNVRRFIEEDRRVDVAHLASVFEVSTGTIFNILHDDLGLVKKSARWVPKLLSKEQKDTRVACSRELKKMIEDDPSSLTRIVTMDETMVSLFTPERKEQSKQWLPKGSPAPVKAKTQASRRKRMVLAFFDANGLIYSRIADENTRVNANYIVDTLNRFLNRFQRKRPELWAQKNWWFHWDNASVHTAAVVMEHLTAKAFKVIRHPPYSPDLAPADFFLFPKVKNALAGVHLDDDKLKKAWDGVTATIAAADWMAAFNAWVRRCNKCIDVAGNFVEK